jgi:TP901 family phage tail tape measure protein
MATGSINLNANLTLNTQSLNAASKQAQQALGRITGQASEFQKSLDASTARVFAFGATTTILNGVSQAFKALVANTIEVEKRIIEIGSILGGTTSELSALRNTIFSVAKDTGQAFGTVADAAAELARQGLSAEDTSKRLSAALVLTRVSGLDSVKSVKALTSAINGFTSAGLTAEQITNKLVAVDTKFAVSAQDLAEGFSRAGSTAEDAGVSFDELLGIITAVEQKTARGGAVIGNALKSIFARLSRSTTIDDLRELGVEIDSSQTGIQKLQSLSAALENVADPTVASKIKELAGGVFQINVVSAALKDLGSDTSIFAAAAKTAAGATNEAFTKNAQLNQSISSQINSLIIGLTNLSEKIGTITFGPILKNLLSLANTFSTFLEEAFDPEKGNKFIQGLFKGIGSFLAGPGLVIITTAFLKIFTLVAKFAKEGFKTILEIGTQTEKIKGIEGGIVGLLARDQQLRAVIASTTATQAQKEAAVIAAIQKENILLTQQEQLLRSIATAAAQRGVGGYTTGGGFSGKGGKRFAAGYMEEEATAKMLGASPSVRAKQGRGTIGGKKFIMNNQETEIPNFGRNGDSAVIPHYAKGFVPNFATYKIGKSEYGGAAMAAALKSGKVTAKQAEEAGYKTTINKKQIAESNILDSNQIIGKNTMPTILTPNFSGKTREILRKNIIPGKQVKFQFKSFGVDPSGQLGLKKEFDSYFGEDRIIKEATNSALKYAQMAVEGVSEKPVDPTSINKVDNVKGFISAIKGGYGGIFDAALATALRTNVGDDVGGDFDVNTGKSGRAKTNVRKLFGSRSLPLSGLADYKINAGDTTLDSMIRKTMASPMFSGKIYAAGQETKKGKASGFIPNFNSVNKGIPVSRIRAHFDQSGNPIAVTNTRDEPNGLKDAIGREKKGIGMAAKGFIPNYALSRGVPAGMSSTGMRLPPLPNIAPQVQQLGQSLDTGTKAFDKFGTGSLAASFALSLIPEMIPEIKETDSVLASSAKSLFETTTQFASVGAAFGPLGLAAGAAAGAIYGAYKNITNALNEEANANKELEKTTKKVDAQMKGLNVVTELTASALGLGKVFDESGNRILESKTIKNVYDNIINSYKAEGESTDKITNAKQKVKDVYSNSASSQEEREKASEEYTNLLNSSMSTLANTIALKAKLMEQKLKFDKLNTSISKFAEALEKQAVKLDQQKFAEGIASNVYMSEKAPYKEAVKSSLEVSQGRTTALASQGKFMGNFAGPDFSNMLNDVQKVQMLGKTGAEVTGAISKDVFSAYMKDGAIGAGKALDNYLKGNLDPEDAKRFKDNVISSAETFRNNVAEVMQKAVNRQSQLNDEIGQLTDKISEVTMKLIANLPEKLKQIREGPKVDVGGLYSGYQQASKLMNTGKTGDTEKAQQIIVSLGEQANKFKELFGEKAFAQLSTSAGIGMKEQEKLQQSAIFGKTDLSFVEEGVKKSLGFIPESIQKAIKAAKLDSANIPALQSLVGGRLGSIDSSKTQKTKQDILNQLEVLKTPQTGKEEKDKLSEEKERAVKELEIVTATIKKLQEDFKPTGIPEAIVSLTKSVQDAATNIAGFTEFTKNLNSLSSVVNGRLTDIEIKLGQITR